MSLLKLETTCMSCERRYILVIEELNLHDVTVCPFCASPVEDSEEEAE